MTNVAESWAKAGEESFKKQQSNGSVEFMKFEKGENRVRLVGAPKQVYIAWVAGKKYIVPKNQVVKVESLGITVRENMAINVIDRAESEIKFKILEKGASVFGPIMDSYRIIKDTKGKLIEPGGPKGQDWLITTEIPGGDKKKTKYTVVNAGQVPFTKEELKAIGPKYANIVDLDEYYNDERCSKRLQEIFNGNDEMESEDVDSVLSDDDDEDSLLSDDEDSENESENEDFEDLF